MGGDRDAAARRRAWIRSCRSSHVAPASVVTKASDAGREHLSRPLLERASRDPTRFDQAKREHYAALYAQPGAMRALPSSGPSARMRPTTSCSLRRASFRCRPRLRWRRRIRPSDRRVVRRVADDVEDAIIGLRALDHGRVAPGDDRPGRRLLRRAPRRRSLPLRPTPGGCEPAASPFRVDCPSAP
jgi:hypothetical protein